MDVPVLALMPLPLLRMRRTSFSFSVGVLSTLSRATRRGFSLRRNGDIGRPRDKKKFGLQTSLTPGRKRNDDASGIRRDLSTGVGIGIGVHRTSVPTKLSGLLRLATDGVRMRRARTRRVARKKGG